MEYSELTAEQKAKVKDCKNAEDLLALAKEEGYELSDSELESISGGGFWDNENDCPYYANEEYDICPTAWHA